MTLYLMRRLRPNVWYVLVIPAFTEEERQEDLKFKAGIDYNVRPCLKGKAFLVFEFIMQT